MLQKALVTIILLFAISIAYILKEAGVFHQIKPHFDGTETSIAGTIGAEDITTDLSTGIAYISAHNRRDFWKNEGMIFSCNLAARQTTLKPIISEELPFKFRPHGISLLSLNDSTKYLFVVNHEEDVNSIIRFRLNGNELIFEKRFIHDQIKYPNDVLAISPESFYITNDHTIPVGLRRTLGDFIIEKSGNVVFYKDGEAAQVTDGIAYANGINISPDNKILWVTSTTENKLFAYEHNQSFGPRKKIIDKYLYTAPDNIEVDKFGDLWIGCHPKLLKYLGHAKDANKHSPSEVIKISYQPDSKHKFLQEEVYMNDGSAISGSSVASYFITDSSNVILVGSVFDKSIAKLQRNL